MAEKQIQYEVGLIDGLVTNQNNKIEVTLEAPTLQMSESPLSNAESVHVGLLSLSVKGDGTYRVTGKGGVVEGIIYIPSSYNEKAITEIGPGAFMGETQLKKVHIPSSVTLISSNAFSRCTELEEVEFDDPEDALGLQISVGAFSGCTKLSEFNLPNRATTIGKEAFKGCTSLTIVYNDTGNRLVSIGEQAFSGCTSLTQALFESGLTEIGSEAFSGCSKLEQFNWVSTITTIKRGAFKNCLGLTGITLPESLTLLGMGAFLNDPVPEGSYSRYIKFDDPYTWFISDTDTPEDSDLTLFDPTNLYDADDSSLESGANRINGNRLSLNSTGNYAGYYWHKIKQMHAPKISIYNGTLNITDPLGVAEYFYIYVNNNKKPRIAIDTTA